MLLYDNPGSSNAMKVRFLLAELGLAYDRREVPFARPRPGWYTAVNPLGGIPALEDRGRVLSESNAILRYLAAREDAHELYGADAAARAPVDELLDRFSLTLRPALRAVEVAALDVGGAAPDPHLLDRRRREAAPVLEVFEQVVDDSGYALGRFTIADCAAAPALHRTRSTGLDLSRFPRLAQWRDTVLARPAFAQAAG